MAVREINITDFFIEKSFFMIVRFAHEEFFSIRFVRLYLTNGTSTVVECMPSKRNAAGTLSR